MVQGNGDGEKGVRCARRRAASRPKMSLKSRIPTMQRAAWRSQLRSAGRAGKASLDHSTASR